MNLNQLRYFRALAKIQHYTKAAEALDISQPSLSHAMAALEKELGTFLFEKQGRSVILTKYGKQFLTYVEQSLKTLDYGIDKIHSLSSSSSGTIDIGYIFTQGIEFVPKNIRAFIDENPEIDISYNLTVGNTTEMLDGLKEGLFDIVFCSYREKAENFEFTPINREELVVIVPNGHKLSEKDEIELSETLEYPQITFTQTSGLRPVLNKMFSDLGEMPEIAFEIEDDNSIAGLVAVGFGIAIVPNIPALKMFNIKPIKLKNCDYERLIYMVKINNRYSAPVVNSFHRFMKERAEI